MTLMLTFITKLSFFPACGCEISLKFFYQKVLKYIVRIHCCLRDKPNKMYVH